MGKSLPGTCPMIDKDTPPSRAAWTGFICPLLNGSANELHIRNISSLISPQSLRSAAEHSKRLNGLRQLFICNIGNGDPTVWMTHCLASQFIPMLLPSALRLFPSPSLASIYWPSSAQQLFCVCATASIYLTILNCGRSVAHNSECSFA